MFIGINDYIEVVPSKDGVLSSAETDKWIVKEEGCYIKNPESVTGKAVIIEEANVIRLNVDGETKYYVRKENIIAVGQ